MIDFPRDQKHRKASISDSDEPLFLKHALKCVPLSAVTSTQEGAIQPLTLCDPEIARSKSRLLTSNSVPIILQYENGEQAYTSIRVSVQLFFLFAPQRRSIKSSWVSWRSESSTFNICKALRLSEQAFDRESREPGPKCVVATGLDQLLSQFIHHPPTPSHPSPSS